MTAIGINFILGIMTVITLCFVLGDIDEILKTPTGYPFIQIFYNVTKSFVGTNILVAIVVITLTGCTMSLVVTASRQLWSFARDKGVPFSATLSYVRIFHDSEFIFFIYIS